MHGSGALVRVPVTVRLLCAVTAIWTLMIQCSSDDIPRQSGLTTTSKRLTVCGVVDDWPAPYLAFDRYQASASNGYRIFTSNGYRTFTPNRHQTTVATRILAVHIIAAAGK